MPPLFRQVVVGQDGSPNARRTVAFVARMRPPGRATLVWVIEPVHPPSVGLMPSGIRNVLASQAQVLEAARRARAARGLAAAAARLRRAGWRVRTEVRIGVPITELLAAVAAARADLFALGARGTGGVARMLLGSVAEGAVKRSPVPTLIVK